MFCGGKNYKDMKLTKIISLLVCLGMAIACTEETFEYSDPSDIATFALPSRTLMAVSGDEEANIQEILIASPVRAAVPRTYVVKVKETGTSDEAVEGEDYDILAPIVTILPGELTGVCRIALHPDKLDETAEKVINLVLSATQADHPVADFGHQMIVRLKKTCAFVPEDLPGIYTIQTALLPSPEGVTTIYDVEIVPDPEVENGFTVIAPYHPASSVDLKLRLYPMKDGTWQAVVDDVPLIGLITETGEKKIGWAYGEGVYYPCNKVMLMSWNLHYEGSQEVLAVLVDTWMLQRF